MIAVLLGFGAVSADVKATEREHAVHVLPTFARQHTSAAPLVASTHSKAVIVRLQRVRSTRRLQC